MIPEPEALTTNASCKSCECGKETVFVRGNPTHSERTIGVDDWLMEYRCTDFDCLRTVCIVEQWITMPNGIMKEAME